MQQDDKVLQALKRYVRAELDGHTFYRMAAARTDDARGKKMFASLASDEIAHANKLAAEYQQVLKTGQWASIAALDSFSGGLDADQLSVFAQGQESILPQMGEATTDLEALSLAIEMEKASYEAYARAAAEASAPAARDVFEFLMKEEQGHLDLVRSSHEYLAKTDSWFEALERPIFEG